MTLEDGREVTVNTTDDAVKSRSASTPIPGHQARTWTFVKDVEDGTSVVHALVSWNGDDPADYLMAGWRAEFPGQHLPDLSLRNAVPHSIVGGPEIDSSAPPELPPEGTATHSGQAGGLYACVARADWGDDTGVLVGDEHEGVITMTAGFARSTLSGCIGCEGDLVTRRAHFGFFLRDGIRDIRSIAADYELHFGDTLFSPDGTIQNVDVTVRHPARAVTHSGGTGADCSPTSRTRMAIPVWWRASATWKTRGGKSSARSFPGSTWARGGCATGG